MEFMDSDEELFLTRNCFSQEVSEPNFSMGKDRQIHWKLQETVEWLLLLTMKNLKRGRHLEYRKYTNNTHIVGSPCLVWMGGGTQRFDPNHWRQWDHSPSQSWDFEYHWQGRTFKLLAQQIRSLNWTRGLEQFYVVRNRKVELQLIAVRELLWEWISINFFVLGFICIKSLSRGIYLYKSLKRGIYTDKFLINSFQFNSSAPLFPATLSNPPRTLSLLTIQEGCTLNKRCWITKEKVWIMK